jgi:Flp pilus assembly pilin Flp
MNKKRGGGKMNRLIKRAERGQSILEYVIIFTAIIAAIALAAGPVGTAVKTLIGKAETKISSTNLD